ncbi:hypothetical protein E2320_000783 [Naja naja]|nr:hypothetical protein E2320_000783 [Naja naja]
MAARLQARKTLRSAKQDDKNNEVVQELHQICQALGMPEPDPTSSVAQVMDDIGSQKALDQINQVLGAEYQCRRHMMLTRFDVTVASFHWSERAKSLPEDSQFCLSHLLAAREDFSRIVKTSSEALRSKTSCAVNKVLMKGSVPDRGGRPNEIEAPMPTWEKRREGGGGGGQRWAKRGKKKKK